MWDQQTFFRRHMDRGPNPWSQWTSANAAGKVVGSFEAADCIQNQVQLGIVNFITHPSTSIVATTLPQRQVVK